MAGTVREYNAKDVTVTVKSVYLTGFAESSMVEFSKDEDNFSVSVGAQGDVLVSNSNNPLGTVSVTLQQGSPYVEFLNRLAKSGEIIPVWVTYSGFPKQVIGGSQARVRKSADGSFTNDASDGNRQFDFTVFDYSET